MMYMNAIKENRNRLKFLLVNWLGLEPRAHTLKVYCSTN